MASEPTFTIVDPPKSIFRRKRFLLPFGAGTATALACAIALFASGAVAMSSTVVIEALMASKMALFNDAQVKRILMAKRIQVHVTDSGGSIGILTGKQKKKANEYDFVMPSGQMVGEALNKSLGGQRFVTFNSPLVLGAFRDYAEALVDAGAAERRGEAQYFDVDMAKLVALANPSEPQTWENYHLPNENQMIAQSPDPCGSYSGAAYVGLVAFVANGGKIITADDVTAVSAKIRPVLTVEGQHETGLGSKFFHQDGQTVAPVAVIYEHQYLAYQIKKLQQTGRLDTDRVLLYPKARHTTEPWLIAFSEKGEEVGRLLEEDLPLRQRALELGFRLSTTGPHDQLLKRPGIPLPELNQTESFMPKSEDLAKLIHAVYGCAQVEVPW